MNGGYEGSTTRGKETDMRVIRREVGVSGEYLAKENTEIQ